MAQAVDTLIDDDASLDLEPLATPSSLAHEYADIQLTSEAAFRALQRRQKRENVWSSVSSPEFSLDGDELDEIDRWTNEVTALMREGVPLRRALEMACEPAPKKEDPPAPLLARRLRNMEAAPKLPAAMEPEPAPELTVDQVLLEEMAAEDKRTQHPQGVAAKFLAWMGANDPNGYTKAEIIMHKALPAWSATWHLSTMKTRGMLEHSPATGRWKLIPNATPLPRRRHPRLAKA